MQEARMLNGVNCNHRGNGARNVQNVRGAGVGGVVHLRASRMASAQATAAVGADGPTCAALLSNDSSAGTHLGPTDSTSRSPDTTARTRADSASFGIGGARSGAADVILLVGVHADQVTFAKQPHLRVRLCF